MTTTIRAHYDGKVIVPDEPVDLPFDYPLTLHVQEAKTESVADSTSRKWLPLNLR